VDVLVAFASYGTVTQALTFGVPMVVVGKGENNQRSLRVLPEWNRYLSRHRHTDGRADTRCVYQILVKPEYRACAQKLAQESRLTTGQKAGGASGSASCRAGGGMY
jgi:UDP:flavonoid glycosyltransferase YjiC (YdhE family)